MMKRELAANRAQRVKFADAIIVMQVLLCAGGNPAKRVYLFINNVLFGYFGCKASRQTNGGEFVFGQRGRVIPVAGTLRQRVFWHIKKSGLDVLDLVTQLRRLLELEIPRVFVHLVFEFFHFGH